MAKLLNLVLRHVRLNGQVLLRSHFTQRRHELRRAAHCKPGRQNGRDERVLKRLNIRDQLLSVRDRGSGALLDVKVGAVAVHAHFANKGVLAQIVANIGQHFGGGQMVRGKPVHRRCS